MSDSEEAKLDSEIEKIRTNYDFDVVLLTVESLEGYTPEAFADDYYDYNGYGIGDNNDGVLFLISMEERMITIPRQQVMVSRYLRIMESND